MNLETLLDSFTMDAHHASVVFSTVTQDFDYVRSKEEAFTDSTVVKSTWELCQLQLPWDVRLPLAAIHHSAKKRRLL